MGCSHITPKIEKLMEKNIENAMESQWRPPGIIEISKDIYRIL